MKNFVCLPNGDKIRADAIIAVRTLRASCDGSIKPRVVVDFGLHENTFGNVVTGGMSSTICYLDTDEECIALSEQIMGQIHNGNYYGSNENCYGSNGNYYGS